MSKHAVEFFFVWFNLSFSLSRVIKNRECKMWKKKVKLKNENHGISQLFLFSSTKSKEHRQQKSSEQTFLRNEKKLVLSLKSHCFSIFWGSQNPLRSCSAQNLFLQRKTGEKIIVPQQGQTNFFRRVTSMGSFNCGFWITF